MKITVYQVDAFTDKPFAGNPGAVCPLDEWLPDHVMQQIAAEMNLSETAFFVPKPGTSNEFDLRWFTPTVEVRICGHATLASGHVVMKHLSPKIKSVKFNTLSGLLGVKAEGGMLQLDFPINPPTPISDKTEIEAVKAALGAEPIEILHANTTLAVFENESQVAVLEPNFAAVLELQEPWLLVTAPADAEEYDFVSRFFVPSAGVNEDPATGSSHTILTPYWANRFGRNKLVGRQISKRGGTMYCEVVEDRVLIAGDVVEVMIGELNIEV